MDSKNRTDLQKLILLLRKNGVVSFKSGDLDLSLHPSSLFPETSYRKKKKENTLKGIVEGQENVILKNDDILFWSTSQLPEMN